MSAGRWLAIVASVVVAATLVAAIVVMDSPAEQREQRMDARRVQDLQRLERAVASYHAMHKSLPADMATIEAQPGWDLAAVDPESGQPYAYEVTGERSYRVCASFDTDTAAGDQANLVLDEWKHDAGPHCFSREVQAPAA